MGVVLDVLQPAIAHPRGVGDVLFHLNTLSAKLIFDNPWRARCVLECQSCQINTRRYYPFIMIRIHTYAVTFQIKRILAEFQVLELVFVQVWPSPYPGIDHVWKALSARNL